MKRAVVTGGTRGLGAALARWLIEDGWDVLAPGSETLDVCRDDHVQAFARGLPGPVDLLINNAGVAVWQDSPEAAAHCFAVNALGAMRVTKALLPWLTPDATIVFVTSELADRKALPLEAAPYAMSKAAIQVYARALHSSRGRRCISICPGSVRTDMNPMGTTEPGEAARNILDRALKSRTLRSA